jgi:hypothetical protein
MAFVRILVMLVGIVLLAFGLLFAGQGSGLIMWPADSFMLADRSWTVYGLMIALAGAAIILISRRIGRT